MYIYIYGRENSLIVEDRYYYSCIPLACLYEKIFGFGRIEIEIGARSREKNLKKKEK